jgi:nicotinamide mononucleotide adenylyltransferase
MRAHEMRVHVINGRFQPFHLGHLNYAREAAATSDLLVLGLTRPPLPTSAGEGSGSADIAPHRLAEDNNPLLFAERAYIAQSAVAADEHIKCPAIVVPFPIDTPKLIPRYVPLEWTIYTTDHEPWNHFKEQTLRELGYRVEIVCRGSAKTFNGSDIRRLLARGDSGWRELVPTGTADALDVLGIPARLQRR